MKNKTVIFATFLGLLIACNPALGMEKKPKPAIKTLRERHVKKPQIFNMSKEELQTRITENFLLVQVAKIAYDKQYNCLIFYTKKSTFALQNALRNDKKTLANNLCHPDGTNTYIDIQHRKNSRPVIYQVPAIVAKNFWSAQGRTVALPDLKIIDHMPDGSTMHEVTEILSNRCDQTFSIKYQDKTRTNQELRISDSKVMKNLIQ